GLRRADDRPRVHRTVVFVEDLGCAAECEGSVVRVRLDDYRVAQTLTQALDLGLEMRLVILGDVGLGSLLEVPEGAGGEDALRHGPALDSLKLLELGLERF